MLYRCNFIDINTKESTNCAVAKLNWEIHQKVPWKLKVLMRKSLESFITKIWKKLKKPHKIIKFKLISKNCSYVASPWSNCNIWFAFTFISRCHAITGCVFQRQYIHSKAFFTSGTENEHFMHLTRYDDIWTFLYMLPI